MTAMMGSLLDIVECPHCGTQEWDQATLDRWHARARASGLTCETQERALVELSTAIHAGSPAAAHAAYEACRHLGVPHLDEYAFHVLHEPDATLTLPDVYGVGVHHYVGQLRGDSTLGATDSTVNRVIEVCACGAPFPGTNPKTGVYDMRPDLSDHIEGIPH